MQVKWKGVKRMEDKLNLLANRALPYANREALTNMARKGQVIARDHVSRNMILKNKFTSQSIQFRRATGLRIPQQESRMGSTVAYMRIQEFGGINKKKLRSKHGIVLNTSESANQPGQNPRTKLPISSNKIKNIILSRRKNKGKTRRQKNLFAVREAVKKGGRNRFVFLDTGKSQAIYRIKGRPENPDLRMMHNLSLKSANIPKNPWLFPSIQKVKRFGPAMYVKALKYQLRFHQIGK